jgi:hypothetical protein
MKRCFLETFKQTDEDFLKLATKKYVQTYQNQTFILTI